MRVSLCIPSTVQTLMATLPPPPGGRETHSGAADGECGYDGVRHTQQSQPQPEVLRLSARRFGAGQEGLDAGGPLVLRGAWFDSSLLTGAPQGGPLCGRRHTDGQYRPSLGHLATC